MKKLLTLFLISVLAVPAFAQKQKPGVTYDATLLRVVDGATVAFAAPWYSKT